LEGVEPGRVKITLKEVVDTESRSLHLNMEYSVICGGWRRIINSNDIDNDDSK